MSLINNVTGPSSVKSGETFTVTITYSGSGNADVECASHAVTPTTVPLPQGGATTTAELKATGDPGTCDIDFVATGNRFAFETEVAGGATDKAARRATKAPVKKPRA
ncbi:MAG TPA: hypothetical protein VGM56_09660 [Byssovorax sp.]|jgi:hypothetical protein